MMETMIPLFHCSIIPIAERSGAKFWLIAARLPAMGFSIVKNGDKEWR